MASMCKIKILIVIMPRGKGDLVTDFLRDKNILFNLDILGKGTDPNFLFDFLGIGESKKDIVFSVIDATKVTETLDALSERFKLNEKGHGVAFTININSVSCKRILNYFTGVMEDTKNEL